MEQRDSKTMYKKEARKEETGEEEKKIWERQTEKNVKSAAAKKERTIKDAYRRFVKSGKVKEEIGIYFNQVKLHIKALIEY